MRLHHSPRPELGAKPLGLLLNVLHKLGTQYAFGEPWKILNFGGDR